MSQAAPSPKPASHSWLTVWLLAVTRPSVATFEKLVQGPQVSAWRAGLWVFLSALVGYGGAGLLQWAVRSYSGFRVLESSQEQGTFVASLSLLLCSPPATAAFAAFKVLSFADGAQTWPGLGLTPFVALGAVVGLMLNTGITQTLANTLGGNGTSTRQLYAFAAYLAPLTLVMCAVSVVPLLNYVALPLALYGLVLNLLAIKAVQQFGWGEALASSGLVFFLCAVLLAAVAFGLLLALAAAAGDTIYQNINGHI